VAGIQGLAWSEGSYSSEQLRRLNDRLVWGWLPGRGGHVLAEGRHQGGGEIGRPHAVCRYLPSLPIGPTTRKKILLKQGFHGHGSDLGLVLQRMDHRQHKTPK
jgi:hypothetical protein